VKTLVVYDSVYGNTEIVARAIGDAIPGEVQVLRVGQVNAGDVQAVDLLIVGSPTQKFRPLGSVTSFLKSIPQNGLQGIKVAAFDTRFPPSAIDKVRILAFFVKIFGYAAEPIAKRLQSKGGDLVTPPAWFYVADMRGPLLDGELARAADWAKQIAVTFSNK
jgi:flavodoxin